jgi:hypothetical protein
MNNRYEIKEAVLNLLKNNTIAGDKIVKDDYDTISDDPADYPKIAIYTPEENVVERDNIDKEVTCKLDIELLVTSKNLNALDDVEGLTWDNITAVSILDYISKQVAQLMAEDETLGGIVSDTILNRTKTMSANDTDIAIISQVMEYELKYLQPSVSTAPETELTTITTPGLEVTPNG